MKKIELRLLDINLSQFDGEGGAPGSGGADSGVAPATSKTEPEQVVYGKQSEGEMAKGDGTKPKADEKPDLSAEFESKIKGDYKELFDKRVQDILNKRFKEVKALETKASEADKMIKLLSKKYGTDKAEEIYQRMESETIEELAYAEGMSPDKYKAVMEAEDIKARDAEQKRHWAEQERIAKQLETWTNEAEAMKVEYPDFDLSVAAQDDKFIDLIKSGVPVKAAYELLNIDNIKADIAKKAQAQVTQNIQAKHSRPKEAAAGGQQGVVVKSDVSQLTAKDRAEIAKRAARGERITF